MIEVWKRQIRRRVKRVTRLCVNCQSPNPELKLNIVGQIHAEEDVGDDGEFSGFGGLIFEIVIESPCSAS